MGRKIEWQEAAPWASYVLNQRYSSNKHTVILQVIDRDNRLLFEAKQDGEIEEAFSRAMETCSVKLRELGIDCYFWYNPYYMNCKDVKMPHYDKRIKI